MIHIQNILVPVDFSEASTNAACFAASLARAYHARLYVLHVKEPFPAHGRIMAGSLEDIRRHRLSKEKKQLTEVIPAKLKNSITVEEIQVTGIPVARVIVEIGKGENMKRKRQLTVILMAAFAGFIFQGKNFKGFGCTIASGSKNRFSDNSFGR